MACPPFAVDFLVTDPWQRDGGYAATSGNGGAKLPASSAPTVPRVASHTAVAPHSDTGSVASTRNADSVASGGRSTSPRPGVLRFGGTSYNIDGGSKAPLPAHPHTGVAAVTAGLSSTAHHVVDADGLDDPFFKDDDDDVAVPGRVAGTGAAPASQSRGAAKVGTASTSALKSSSSPSFSWEYTLPGSKTRVRVGSDSSTSSAAAVVGPGPGPSTSDAAAAGDALPGWLKGVLQQGVLTKCDESGRSWHKR